MQKLSLETTLFFWLEFLFDFVFYILRDII